VRPPTEGVQQAVEDAIDLLSCLDALGGRHGTVTLFRDADVDRACKIVYDTQILDQIRDWREEDRERARAAAGKGSPGHGGAPLTLGARAVVVALVLLGLNSEPLLITNVVTLMEVRISRHKQAELGIDTSSAPPDTASAEELRAYSRSRYARAWRRIRELFDVIEPYPVPHRRLLTDEEYLEVRTSWDPEEVARKRDRLDWVVNQLMEVSLRAAPTRVKAAWRGSTCIDGTGLRLWARGPT